MTRRLWTLAEARYILSHVYCVRHLPTETGVDPEGWTYDWASWAGEALCSSCPCRKVPDLRLYVPSPKRAAAWLEVENAAVAAVG